MKFIKTVAVLLAVSVSLMVPSFAWDSDSFVGQDFYFYEPVINYSSQAPSLIAEGDTSSGSSYSLSDFTFSCDDLSFYSYVEGYWPEFDAGSVVIPGYWVPYYSGNVSVSGWQQYVNNDFLNYFSGSYSVPVVDVPSDTITTFRDYSIKFNPANWQFTISFSSPVYALAFDGLLNSRWNYQIDGTFYEGAFDSCSIFVDNRNIKTYSPSSSGDYQVFDFGGYVYSSPDGISSLTLSFHSPYFSLSGDFEGSTFNLAQTLFLLSSSFRVSVLSDDGILSGQAGSTQDDVNEIEGLESQWGNSMTENFNALSLDTFTYPDGLTSGFALISGIFQDLWNAMGSYSILYVLPLTLGVILVIIGRISKFDGRGSDDSSDGGGVGAFLARRDR